MEAEIDKTLLTSCNKVYIEAVKESVRRGANINAVDSNGMTGIMMLFKDSKYMFDDDKKREQRQVFDFILQQPSIDLNMSMAIVDHSVPSLPLNGSTVLHMIANRVYDEDDLQYFITKIVSDPRFKSLNVKNTYGTALMCAIDDYRRNAAQILLQVEGTDFQLKNSWGRTLVEQARRVHGDELAKLIEDAENKAEAAKTETASSNAEQGVEDMKARLEKLQTRENQRKQKQIQECEEQYRRKVDNEKKEHEEKVQHYLESMESEFRSKMLNIEQEKEEEIIKITESSEFLAETEDIKEKIKKIQSKINEIISSPKKVPSAPECPVCTNEMLPPLKIFNCANGHAVCENCRTKLNSCPKCRENIVGRATELENFIKNVFEN